MKSLFPCCLLLLVLSAGCGELPRTEPSEEARAQGVVNPGVTLLDAPRLQDGIGEIDADVSREFQTTESGLQYRILRASAAEQPGVLDTVTVHYRGWLDNGRVFDESYEKERTSTFALRSVVKGWTEGLQLIGQGGMIELWIPSEMGYGKRGMGNEIPPNSALHFVVELQQVHKLQ